MASKAETQLIEAIAGLRYDPLKFVLFAFPWGEAGTDLQDKTGPREWQRQVLTEIGDGLKRGMTTDEAVQTAVASGHGVGKSALVSWLVLWAMSTCPDTKAVVTANTESQLRTKTWPEVKKWHRLSINSHWFKVTATALFSTDGDHEKTWRCDAIPWSEHNTEAFAGMHNEGKRILLVFDEASAIPDLIWEVAEGALTDEKTEIIWTVFGNPTRNTGRFRECFGSRKHRWIHRQIDSRDVDGTNKAQLNKWIEDYGDDSDFVRVRVKGQFPRAGSMQFIPSDVVERAQQAEDFCLPSDPIVMGCDVARYGDDNSVIKIRRGRAILHSEEHSGMDTMQLAARVCALIGEWNVDAVFIDETGVGGGVIDRVRQLGHACIGVNNGAKSDVPIDGVLVANKGAECWARMREWLKTGGSIPAGDADMAGELISREYGYNAHNQIVLERKADMKKRGVGSPDRADALALTFAYPVAERGRLGGIASGSAAKAATDWNPFGGDS